MTTANKAIGSSGTRHRLAAILAIVTRVTQALAVLAKSLTTASVQAGLVVQRSSAVITTPAILTEASSVFAETTVGAIVFASHHSVTGHSGKSGVAKAHSTRAESLSRAHLTSIRWAWIGLFALASRIAGFTVANTQFANTSSRAFARTSFNGAIVSKVSRSAGAQSVLTDTITRAVLRTRSSPLVINRHKRLQEPLTVERLIAQVVWSLIGHLL